MISKKIASKRIFVRSEYNPEVVIVTRYKNNVSTIETFWRGLYEKERTANFAPEIYYLHNGYKEIKTKKESE